MKLTRYKYRWPTEFAPQINYDAESGSFFKGCMWGMVLTVFLAVIAGGLIALVLR